MNKKKNKENRFYWAVYTCQNCGTKMDLKIPFGESIPILVKDLPANPYTLLGIQQAPECSYCGCMFWSHGKKPG